MIFEGHSIKDMLMFYSTIVGTNTSPDEERLLLDQLKTAVKQIDPLFEIGDSLTSYEAFVMVSNMEPQEGNVMVMLDDVEGYLDTNMEYTTWDPLIPVDDTQQYPDDECVQRSLEPCIPCSLPAREEYRPEEVFLGEEHRPESFFQGEEHRPEDFFQGEEIVGLLTDEFQDVSLFDESKPVNDTDQLPEEDNVPTVDRSVFSTDYARRDFV
jgi:hypothetical protein